MSYANMAFLDKQIITDGSCFRAGFECLTWGGSTKKDISSHHRDSRVLAQNVTQAPVAFERTVVHDGKIDLHLFRISSSCAGVKLRVWSLWVKKNLSPSISFLNCTALMQLEVGPVSPSLTGVSACPRVKMQQCTLAIPLLRGICDHLPCSIEVNIIRTWLESSQPGPLILSNLIRSSGHAGEWVN